MKEYYQPNNQVPFETLKDKWSQQKLRDLLFINCTFESTSILSKKYPLISASKNVESEETTNQLKEIDNQYYDFAFNNIKKTLDIMGVQENNKIIVYSELEDYKILLINNEIEKLSEDFFKGTCTYDNCLRLIRNTTCRPEECFPQLSCSILPTLKDGGYKDLYHFPELKLYLFIYDDRGGLIVSEDYDRHKMKVIFEKCLRACPDSDKKNQGDVNSLITSFKEGEISCLHNYHWIDESKEAIYDSYH